MRDAPAFPFPFIVAEHDARHQRVVAVDCTGAVVHCYACDDLPLDVDLRSDGHLLLTTRKAVIELDADWREVWRHTLDEVFATSCQWLPDGAILIADTSRAQVYALDPVTHQMLRAIDVPCSPDLSPPYNLFRNVRQLANGRILVACLHDRKIAEFEWDHGLVWHAPVEGTPYQALRRPNGNTLVSLGPSGRIVEVDRFGLVIARYDMVEDHGLDRGWIAGITLQPNSTLTYSDSKHNRLVALDWPTKTLRGIYQDAAVLVHPSSHIILS